MFCVKCPNCGAEAKGKFCEYCGSEMPKEKTTINITNNYYVNAEDKPHKKDSKSVKATTKNKKKRTWLWVLGWICIFPLPLTILMLRKKNMKPAVKYGIIAVAWLLFFAIGSSGNGEAEVPETNIAEPTATMMIEETVFDVETELPTEETVSTELPTEEMVIYAKDDVVNRFITEFNAVSSMEITDISQGNIRTKYFGYANGRYLEMINANGAGAEAFCLTINGGQEHSDKQAMYEVFREAVKILDPTITDEMIDAALTEFDTKDVLIEGYRMGDSLSITYVPTKELSYGKNSCRIDIYASNFK